MATMSLMSLLFANGFNVDLDASQRNALTGMYVKTVEAHIMERLTAMQANGIDSTTWAGYSNITQCKQVETEGRTTRGALVDFIAVYFLLLLWLY